MNKAEIMGLTDTHLAQLKDTIESELKRRKELTENSAAFNLVARAHKNGTMVDDIMGSVYNYWDQKFIEACDEWFRVQSAVEAQRLIFTSLMDDAGSLSNTRDELNRGKLDDEDEEEYEKDCIILAAKLTELLTQISK